MYVVLLKPFFPLFNMNTQTGVGGYDALMVIFCNLIFTSGDLD
jgi:hypothetical protein